MTLLTPRECASYLGLAENTLAKWRVHGLGPPYYRLNARCIRYDRQAVDTWIHTTAQRHTAQTRTKVVALRKGGEH